MFPSASFSSKDCSRRSRSASELRVRRSRLSDECLSARAADAAACCSIHLAQIDDHDPFTQLFDILHVVTGEEDGAPDPVAFEEGPNSALARDVQAESWLVQKDDFRVMQKRSDKLALHSFAQTHAPHLNRNLVLEVKKGKKLIQLLPVPLFGDVVKLFQHLKGVHSRQVPPKLLTVAHDQGNFLPEVIGLTPKGNRGPARISAVPLVL